MTRRVVTAAALGLFCAAGAGAQPEGFSVILKGTYTTSSEIFPNPDSPDPVKRAQSFLVDASPGWGAELRYRLPGTLLAVGASVEYQRASVDGELAVAFRNDIPVRDGYRAIPIELTGYFIVPFSTRAVQIYMGGGAGFYIGERIYELAGVPAPLVDSAPGFGIHVVAGVGVALTEHLSVVGGMKFRDLQFTSTNAFSSPVITYNGAMISVGTAPFDSSIHTDGIVFQLGIAYTL